MDYLVEHAINAFQCRHLCVCVCVKMATAHTKLLHAVQGKKVFAATGTATATATATTMATIHNRARASARAKHTE